MTLKRNKDFFDEFLYDFDEGEVVDVVEFDMGYVPFTIERVKDGKILQLNEDNKTYSFTHAITLNPSEYSWGRLFKDHRCVGEFKAIVWVKISNLESAHKAYNNRTVDTKKFIEEESGYVRGQEYEQGIYLGIIDEYPYDVNYFNRQHHFRVPTKGRGVPSIINTILIEKITRNQ